MFELPTSLRINDIYYPIRNNGDFRMVLDCFVALEDAELSQSDRIITSMIIFFDGVKDASDIYEMFGTKETLETAIKSMYSFFNCGQPDGVGAKMPYKLVDWERDSHLIASAVNNVAKREIRADAYLHWWTFMGYYLSIGESAFSHIVEIRHKIKAGKKLEKSEQEFKRENPQYFVWDSTTTEAKQTDDLIRSLWSEDENGG